MEQPTAFLAWSREVADGDALAVALQTVRDQLRTRQYRFYDWSRHHDIRNIGAKVQDLIRRSDIVFLEASTNRANIAFEAGLAAGLRIPQVVLKQVGSGLLPEDYGAPEYLDYPESVDDEVGFRQFKAHLETLLTELERTVLNPSQRAARRSRLRLDDRVTEFVAAYQTDHPFPYLLSGRMDAFTEELEDGGTSRLVTDSDYYETSFDKLRLWEGGTIRAIADLTDDTETFWMPEHPDTMSAHVSERIFLVDWKLFFDGEEDLARHIEGWRRHKERYQGRKYDIYIATKDEADRGHPLSSPAIAQHLLVMDPDSIGGYRRKPGTQRRQLVTERNERRHERALDYYQAIRDRSVLFDPDYTAGDIKRQWLSINRLGYWGENWSEHTENRESEYFAHYDKHVRCWIPSYDQMLRDTAALVEQEILLIWGRVHRPINLLELGYGTGNLTTRLISWIRIFHEAFTDPGADAPVGRYIGIDRAPRMVRRARLAFQDGSSRLQPVLRRGRAWLDVPETWKHDLIFGTLSLHFVLGADPPQARLDEFFAQCARRLSENGSVVIADVFRPDHDDQAAATTERWLGWMVENGMSTAAAETFLAGNADMVRSAVVEDFIEAGKRNGFVCSTHKPVSDPDLPFYVFCFRREP